MSGFDEKASRTEFAQEAFQLGEILELKFSMVRLGRQTPRKLMIGELSGPSTAGGKLARQSLILAPETHTVDNPSGEAITFGWLDSAKREAHLKAFGVIQAQYKRRFSRNIDILQTGYEDFIDDIEKFFLMQAISVETDEKIPEPVVQVAVKRPSPIPGRPSVTETPPDKIGAAGPGPLFWFLSAYAVGFGLVVLLRLSGAL